MQRTKKIDKINFLKEWRKKYPISSLRLIDDTDNYTDFFESKEEVKDFNEMTEKAIKYYDYLRIKKNRESLSDDEISELRELNLGGVFGYSDKVKELRENSNMPYPIAREFLNKYDNLEDLYIAYKKGKELDEFEKDVLGGALDCVINVDECDHTKNYNMLIKAIGEIRGNVFQHYHEQSDVQNIYLYSSEDLLNSFSVLTEGQKKVLIQRFGLEDGKCKCLDEVGKMFGRTRERIRQIEAKALRTLRINYKNKLICNLNDMIDSLELTDEEKELISNAEAKALFSYDAEETKKAKDILKKYVLDRYRTNVIKKELEEAKKELEDTKNAELDISEEELKELIEKKEIEPKDIHINKLGLSVRSYNCLHRAGIRNLQAIIECKNIYGVRNLGYRSAYEVINKVHELGFKLDSEITEEERKAIEEKIQKVEPKDISITTMSLSTRAHNALHRAGIRNLQAIIDCKDLYGIRNLGNKSANEVINKVHEFGYKLELEKIEEERKTTEEKIQNVEPKVNIEVLRTEKEETEKRIQEKEEKSRLLDEYITLAQEHSNLKTIESKLDEEIRKKEEILKGFGFKYE